MLLCSPRSRRALHVPVLFGLAMLALVVVMVLATWRQPSTKNVLTLLFAVAFAFFPLSQLRSLRVIGDRLQVRSLFSAHSLPVDEVALGVSVYRSAKGFSTYTIYAYAHSHGGNVELATTGGDASSQRVRQKLEATLLAARSARADAHQHSRDHVQQKEAAWRTRDAQARAHVARYYRDGAAVKVSLWVFGVALLYALGMLAFSAFRS